MPDNDGVTIREYLEQQINSLREHIDHRFDSLESRCSARLIGCGGLHDDHEARIRTIEKVAPIKTIAQAVIGIVAVIGAALGFKQS